MIHLKRSKCGYEDYICRGIPSIPILQPPVCDNTPYDKTPTMDRQVDNNFLNLPVKFKSIVQSTTVLDLSGITFQHCITEYNPLQGGLMNAFDTLANNSQGYLQEELDALDCFASNSEQPIGILLPSPQLSSFQNVPMLAVPTVALSAAQTGSAAASRAILSGCRGLVITARSTGSYKLRFSVSAGSIFLQNNSSQAPVQLSLKPLNEIQISGQENVASVDVYIVAQYDVVARMWLATLDYTTASHPKENTTPTMWIKRKHLGTIKYNSGRIVDVIQSQCGPVDMRDWVSQIGLPQSSGAQSFLFVIQYQGSSAKKKWVEVRDCS